MLGDLSNESSDPEGSLQHFTPTWNKGDLLPELSPQGLGNFGSSLSSGTLVLGVVEFNSWLQKCSPVFHPEGSDVLIQMESLMPSQFPKALQGVSLVPISLGTLSLN